MRALMAAKVVVLLAAVAAAPAVAAYIGPGAGVSVVGSLLNTLLIIVLAVVAVLAWPVRYLWRRWRRAGKPGGESPD